MVKSSDDQIVTKRIKKGDYFQKNLKKIRPGYGISPSFYDEIIGQVSNYTINPNEPLTKKHLKTKIKNVD